MADRPIFICFRSLDSRIARGIPKVIARCSRCQMAVTITTESWDALQQMGGVPVCTQCLTPEEIVEVPQAPAAGQIREIVESLHGTISERNV